MEKKKMRAKKPSKQRQRNLAQRQRNPTTHGWSGEEDQLCSSTSIKSFFFLLLHSVLYSVLVLLPYSSLLCCCLRLHHEQGNQVSYARVLRAKSSFLDSRC